MRSAISPDLAARSLRQGVSGQEPMGEGRAKVKKPYGFFSKMSNDQLVRFAQDCLQDKGIEGRWELKKRDQGMYQALRKRDLLDRVFGVDERRWSNYDDGQFVRFAQNHIQEKGVTGRNELKKSDYGMYQALRSRNLLDRIFQAKKPGHPSGFFSKMPGDQLVHFAQGHIRENGIASRRELRASITSMYLTLRSRNLLDRVLQSKKLTLPGRSFSKMPDDQLVECTERILTEKGIGSRSDLSKSDHGLYKALLKRNLLDRLNLPGLHRDWESMSDDQLIQYTRAFISEKGIVSRTELSKSDGGLYFIILKRDLIDRIFAPIEQVQEQARKAELDRQLKEGIDLYLGR